MRSGFFNSNITGYDDEGMPIFDRAEDASFFAEYFKSFIGNGIYANPSNNLQVNESSGMKIKVKEGKCFINGIFGWREAEEAQTEITLDNSDATLNRIDRIVVRLDESNRNIDIKVKKGTPALEPIAPVLQRSEDIYELALADVRINKNVSSITQANITDLRLNSELCGIVTSVVEKIDTTTLFNQFTTSFQEWFNSVKDILNEEDTTKMAGEILTLQTKVGLLEINSNPCYIGVTFNNNFTVIENDCCALGNSINITIIGSFKSTQINQYLEIGSVAEEYKPQMDIHFVATKAGMGSVVDGLIDKNGVIKVYITGQNPVGQLDPDTEVRINTGYFVGDRITQGSFTPPVLN